MNATRVTDTVAHWLGVDAAGTWPRWRWPRTENATNAPVLVPYFDGERTPDLPDATGVLAALRNDTTREELALAAHDGVLCGLFDGLDALRSCWCGDPVGALHLIGGGARSARLSGSERQCCTASRSWCPHDDETVALGCCGTGRRGGE